MGIFPDSPVAAQLYEGEVMDAKKKVKETKPDVSRRKFITKAMTGATATAVTVLGNGKASAADKDKEANNAAAKPITVPDEFAQARKRRQSRQAFR